MKISRVLVLAVFAVLFFPAWSCKQSEPAPGDPAISDSDRRKLKAYLDKATQVTRLTDLPPRYHGRTVPTKESGVAFEVYLDEKPLKAVRAEEFTCPEAEQLVSRKGPKSHANCSLIPFLKRLTKKPIAYIELVGEQRDYELERFVPAELEKEGVELAAFLAPRGQVRIEERPRSSLMTQEEAGAKGLREGRKGGKGMGRKKGAMRGRFKTRSLYWVDLFTTPPPPEEAAASGEPPSVKKAPAPAPPLPSEPGKLALVLPGGATKWLSAADVRKCGPQGCALSAYFPADISGRWCVSASRGVLSLDPAQLAAARVTLHAGDGALSLVLGQDSGTSIGGPTSIASCESRAPSGALTPGPSPVGRGVPGGPGEGEGAPSGPAVTLQMPGGENKIIAGADVKKCPEPGCPMKDYLPREFKGDWCIQSGGAGGLTRVSHADLSKRFIKARGRGGFAINEGAGEPGTIRDPKSIAPCP